MLRKRLEEAPQPVQDLGGFATAFCGRDLKVEALNRLASGWRQGILDIRANLAKFLGTDHNTTLSNSRNSCS
jgi:hypothetical protein